MWRVRRPTCVRQQPLHRLREARRLVGAAQVLQVLAKGGLPRAGVQQVLPAIDRQGPDFGVLQPHHERLQLACVARLKPLALGVGQRLEEEGCEGHVWG